MGTDKAVLKSGGRTFLEASVMAATKAGLSVIIIGRQTSELPQLLPSSIPGITAIPDNVPGQGPVGGLLTALRFSDPNEAVLLLPCDIPSVTANHIHWIIGQAKIHLADPSNQIDALVPVQTIQNDPQPEPLFAIYKQSALSIAENHLISGRRSMLSLLHNLSCKYINLDPNCAGAVSDIDSPQDLPGLNQTATS